MVKLLFICHFPEENVNINCNSRKFSVGYYIFAEKVKRKSFLTTLNMLSENLSEQFFYIPF